MKITTATVRRCAAHAKRLSGGTFALAFAAKPGDPPRYVVTGAALTFTGVDAARQAAAYFAGIAGALTTRNPDIIEQVLAETRDRHADMVHQGVIAARRAQHRDLLRTQPGQTAAS
ncbi:MAG: hypothetical protein ABWZ30_00975 [Jiangellaceae bacterium]